MQLRLSDDHARSIATIGLLGLVLVVTAHGQPKAVGPISIDTVTVMVPIAILMAVPYVWRTGIGSVPRYLLGPMALLFLAWGLASVVANGGHVGSFMTMVRYAAYFVLAIVVSVVTRDSAVRRLLLWTIAITGGCTSVLAYSQFANPQLTPGMHGIGPDITTRVVGTFYNSNFYAEYLILVLGVVLALVFTEKSWERVFAGVLGLSMLGALLLTYTRGSWVGLAVGLVVFIVFVDVRYLAAVAVAGLAALFVPGVLSRVSSSTANASSAGFRMGLWHVSGVAMRRRPLFGYGPGEFLEAHRDVVMTRPDLYQGYITFGAHNSYFELAAEIGVLGGLLFFFVTLAYATRGIFVAARADVDRTTKYLALGLSVGLIGILANTFTSNTFQHPQPGLFFWVLAGVVAGLGHGLWDAPPRLVGSKPLPSAGAQSGSVAARLLQSVRATADSTWHASSTYAWVASAKTEGTQWLASSVVLGVLLGRRRAVPGAEGRVDARD